MLSTYKGCREVNVRSRTVIKAPVGSYRIRFLSEEEFCEYKPRVITIQACWQGFTFSWQGQEKERLMLREMSANKVILMMDCD